MEILWKSYGNLQSILDISGNKTNRYMLLLALAC
jgi:hypothetical protein